MPFQLPGIRKLSNGSYLLDLFDHAQKLLLYYRIKTGNITFKRPK